MMNNIKEKIKLALVETLNLDSNHGIENHSKLKDDLGLDSMSSLTFLMKLEETIDDFNVDPETLEMEDLMTVESINHYIAKQIETSAKNNIESLGDIVYA